MMVVGTATAVGVALANERRLTPVFAHATPTYTPAAPRLAARPLPNPRQFLASKLATASLGALLVIAVVATIPALSTFASSFAASSPAAAEVGPPETLRAGSAAGGGWERSVSAAVPSAGEMGAALMAAKAEEQRTWEVLQALIVMAEQKAAQERAAARPVAGTASAPGLPQTLGRASGLAAGTILRARITVYGCVGPGGGFCGGMSSGVRVFEGAVACSSNLAMGTKLKIHGDPTGRVYECLDRGALPATWIDVYFHNTTDGMRWQGLLGGTVTDIEIVN